MFEIVGWIGAIVYIMAYGLVATHRIAGENRIFHVLNFIGAIGVAIAAWHNHDMPSTVLNIAWGGIALYGFVTTNDRV